MRCSQVLPGYPLSSAGAYAYRLGCPVEARLDVTELEQNVQHYLQSAMSKNTVATYTSAHRRYLDFCHHSSHQAYPASENTLCQLRASLDSRTLSINQSHHTCRACVTITLCNHSQTPSFVTCPGCSMFCEG